MAKFTSSVQPVTSQDAEMRAFNAGVSPAPPGQPLRDLLRLTGGAYKTVVPLSPRFREDLRRAGDLTGNRELTELAERGEVTIGFEHLRGTDPETRVAVRFGISYAPGESDRLGLTKKGPFDPTKGIFVDKNAPGGTEA